MFNIYGNFEKFFKNFQSCKKSLKNGILSSFGWFYLVQTK